MQSPFVIAAYNVCNNEIDDVINSIVVNCISHGFFFVGKIPSPNSHVFRSDLYYSLTQAPEISHRCHVNATKLKSSLFLLGRLKFLFLVYVPDHP